ncbi:sensor histidine kinase [Anaeromicropila herbilytica]|uniref:histidine kinase n=1 Tax=Anaeromicropila herbilytica TaxID=2785025 RepID=A0A7R7EHI4_9FIRM|nr:HAMP domain-containing sensor histidine kinase [Anaeromicropila herbilytica]BCN28799.1 two-component sensor histidine kinase [Anaeromicropila herbilytica]
MFGAKRTFQRLNSMIDNAMNGSFIESDYDETELSKLEVKWKRYISSSILSKKKIEKERENIKSFVSDISHQTKTPLSNIILYSQMLEESTMTKEDKELVREISKQSDKLNFLIQNLVKISRLESETMKIIPIRQEIKPLISSIVSAVDTKLKAKNITLELPEERETGVFACYDKKWTEEAIFNILDNAIKYSRVNTTIKIMISDYDLFTGILIRDQGCGIAKDEINEIFKRFYRSNRAQEKEGIGLGLYLARNIISKQHGYIDVKSEVMVGSTFEIYLPK